MRQLPQMTQTRQSEMRAFYESCGLSEHTIEAAIKFRQRHPFEERNCCQVKRRKKRKKTMASEV